MARRKPFRWHIGVFLAPAVLVYTAIMIIPLFGTLNLSLYNLEGQNRIFVGLANFATLFGDPRWSDAFWNALGNNLWFFVIHMIVQNPIGILLAGLLMALTYIGGELASFMLGLPSAAIQAFQGMLLFFLLAVDLLTNFRIRFGTRKEAL